jgi:hypothetical protein
VLIFRCSGMPELNSAGKKVLPGFDVEGAAFQSLRT